ncbi:hypothetical protein ALI144C_43715 [Actinosynnema sp. ALI-1.44]|nr:hypothetical protein ALI144C_43715 [Actinosynnema sp. ALI-1.44]
MGSLGSPIIGDPTIVPAQDDFETIAGTCRAHQIEGGRARMDVTAVNADRRCPPPNLRWWQATGVAARCRHERCRGLEREE